MMNVPNDQATTRSERDGDQKREVFRFDIFKGQREADGKILKLRSVGSASIAEGSSTYHVRLKSLLNDCFFLLPEGRRDQRCNYAILTREASLSHTRKFFWHRVGEAEILDGANHGLMRLNWDLFPNAEIFMSLYPLEPRAKPLRPSWSDSSAA